MDVEDVEGGNTSGVGVDVGTETCGGGGLERVIAEKASVSSSDGGGKGALSGLCEENGKMSS